MDISRICNQLVLRNKVQYTVPVQVHDGGKDIDFWKCILYYRKTSNISRTLVGNKIVDNSDVVGASPVGAAPTTSSFST